MLDAAALAAKLQALRIGIDDALNIEGYDDDERIVQIADTHWRWLRDAAECAKHSKLKELVRRYQRLPATGWPSFKQERHEVDADAERLLGNPCAGERAQ